MDVTCKAVQHRGCRAKSGRFGVQRYSRRVNPSLTTDSETKPLLGIFAVRVLLLCGAVAALFAGVTMGWRGTALDKIWALNPRAHSVLVQFSPSLGVPFFLLAGCLGVAGTGWIRRKRWGWRFAVAIIGVHLLSDIANIFFGRIAEGAIGVLIAGGILLYMSRSAVRRCFEETAGKSF